MVLNAVPQIRAFRDICNASESMDEKRKITEDMDKVTKLMSRWQRAFYKIKKKYRSVTEQHQKLITDTAESIGNKIHELYEQITEHYILVKTETDTSKTAQLISEMNELKKQAKKLEDAFKSMVTKYKETEKLYYIKRS
jgi:predicted  nucleic acid-binding Zn-ribbon protein